MDTNRLLSPENVNRDKLMQYAREAADFSTEHRLPQLPFALNHYGREDVAMFDFTCMYASQNAGKVMERKGHKLLLQLVGDSLLEVRGGGEEPLAMDLTFHFFTKWTVLYCVKKADLHRFCL